MSLQENQPLKTEFCKTQGPVELDILTFKLFEKQQETNQYWSILDDLTKYWFETRSNCVT